MAIFNPEPPAVNPQDWARQSRSIPQPESITVGDKSLGMTLSTLGEGITDAVGLGKNIQEDIIKDKVRTGVEGLRDNYTESLKTVWNQQQGGSAPTPEALHSAGISGPTLAGEENAAEIPGGLQQGLARAQALGTAMAQNGGAGKANDTLYTGALNSLAKNLRNQYPGSKDYIDEQIAKVSGKNPANAFYENLLQDINRGLAAGKSVQDKDHAFIDRYVDSIEGMDELRKKYDRGAIDSQGLRDFVAQQSKLTINQKAAEAQRAALKSQGELTVQRTKADFAKEAGGAIDNAFTIQRMATDVETPKEISDFFQGQATGQIPQVGEQQNRMWLTNLATQRDTAAAHLRSIALRRDERGDSYASNVGGLSNLKNEINEQLSLYDNIIQRVKDKDYMGVYFTLNQNTAIQNKATNELYADESVGEMTRKMQAVTTAVGPQTGAILLQDAIVGGFDKKYSDYVGGMKKEALGQPNPTPTTMTEAMDNARGKKIADPGVYKSMIDVAKVIANPDVKDQGKINAATFAFNPKNIGSLDKFASPEDRQTAFVSMTDPAITNFISKLPQKTQTEYRNWVEKTWGGTIARDSIADLSRIKDQRYLQSYHVGWNTTEGQFVILNRDNSTLSQVQQTYARPIQSTIDKVNEGLKNLGHVEKSAGGDVNAYLVRTLSNSGFDFRNNVEGIPTKMMDALLNANRKPGATPIDSTIKPPTSK